MLGADVRIIEREVGIFEALRQKIASEAPRVLDTARGIAALDVLSALAETAAVSNYTKPMVHAGEELIATDARHPVVERFAPDAFVPNDVTLDAASHQLIILTGPNMGGKSTYLRQTALLCLLAQTGSFVPARTAKLPVVDRLFARVGASDNIARGQSTFMVEMQETANILHCATSRSLVILDEIGRGTATFDGLSLAWAVADTCLESQGAAQDHLRDALSRTDGSGRRTPRRRQFPRRRSRVERHRLPAQGSAGPLRSELRDPGGTPGRAARHRGRCAAREILNGLERRLLHVERRPSLSGAATENQRQLGLFQAPAAADDPLHRRLRELDVNQLTPLAALTLLAELSRRPTVPELRPIACRVLAGCAMLLCLAATADGRQRYDPRLRFHTISHRASRFTITSVSGSHNGWRSWPSASPPISSRASAEHGRAYVILVDQADASNGWATPATTTSSRSPRHRHATTAPSATRTTGCGSCSRTSTHVVHLERSRGFLGAVGRVFGRNPFFYPNLYIPGRSRGWPPTTRARRHTTDASTPEISGSG